MNLKEKIELAAKWIIDSKRLVVFTGAGISTDSGLHDYRGPDGLWTRRDKGLPPPKMSVSWEDVKPNQGHYAIVDLLNMGKLDYLISQNVDGLHVKSGIPFERLAELHGNQFFMNCTNCNQKMTFEEVGWDKKKWGQGYMTNRVKNGQPNCPKCGRRVVSSIVNFGDSLPGDVLEESFRRSEKSDVFFVIGSSLVVTPAALMPKNAQQNGAKLIILNRGEIPPYFKPNLRFHENIIEVLPAIVAKVKDLLSFS
jgi:mono-ADP-ribosyltransferase sirtuin 6